MTAGLVSQLPGKVNPRYPQIALCGRSNVGKSSLINKLLARKSLARVSSQPGKTATVNFYNCEGARLVDLPGYGYAKVSKSEKQRWNELIDGYFAQDRDIRLTILLIDARHAPTRDDLAMLDYLIDQEYSILIVLTKIDKLNKTERAERLAKFPDELGVDGDNLFPVSSTTGEGIDELREILVDLLEAERE